MSFGSSKSSSKPQDMTPAAFSSLQAPFADTLAGILGYQKGTSAPTPATTKYGITGYRYEYDTVGSGERQVKRRIPVYGNITTPGTPGQTTWTAMPGSFAQTRNPNDLMKFLPKYEGPLTAEMAPNETAMLQRLMDMQAAGPKGPDDALLKAYIESVQRPLLEGLTETLTRDLPGRFTQAGQMVQPQGSSAFDRAAAIATRGVANSQKDIGTQIGYEAYKNSGDRFAQEMDVAIKNLQAQALPRLIQEMGIERGIEQFNSRVNSLMQALGITAGVTQPTIANNQNSKSTQFGIK